MVITIDKILTMAGLKEGQQPDVSLGDILSGKNGEEIFKQVRNLFKGPEKRSQSEAFFDSNEEYKKALLWEAQNKCENIQRVLQIGLTENGDMDSEHEEFALNFIEHCGWQYQIRRNPKNANQKAYVVYADKQHMEPWMVVRCGIPKEDTNYCVIMEFRMVTTTIKPIIKMESALWYTSNINTWKMSDVVKSDEKKSIREKISEMTSSRQKNSESVIVGNPRTIITDDMSLDELMKRETASKIYCIKEVLETAIDQSTGLINSSYEKICDELIEKFGWKCLKKINTQQPNKRIFNIYSDNYEDWMLKKAYVAKDDFKCYVVAKMETVNRDGRWIVENNTRNYFSDNPAHCN